jgi:predicted RNA methylase
MLLIQDDVMEILRGSTCHGAAISLPDMQLDRKLYTAVNKVFANLGGKWNRKAKAHLFTDDVSDAFAEVQESGMYVAKLDELNKVYNFFETPPKLAQRMVEMARIAKGETVLEPSAGKGAIAHAIYTDSPATPDLIELNPELRARLEHFDMNVVGEDFLDCDEHYDVIIANPPFSKGRDAQHILHMIELADRRVVTVCSAACRFRDTGYYAKLTEVLDGTTILSARFVDLPEGTFKESGTMVNTCLLVVEK